MKRIILNNSPEGDISIDQAVLKDIPLTNPIGIVMSVEGTLIRQVLRYDRESKVLCLIYQLAWANSYELSDGDENTMNYYLSNNPSIEEAYMFESSQESFLWLAGITRKKTKKLNWVQKLFNALGEQW